MRSIGLATSQADNIIKTNKLRTLNSTYTGTGINIGVISDSYNKNSRVSTDISTGDLPKVGNPNDNLTPVTV